MRRHASLVVALASFVVAVAPASAAPPTDEQRLERLVEDLDRQRSEMHVPGVAIAVVRGDEVILARGLGLADVENDRPVTDETRFAVGSTTKAFTATLIGMLVDDGLMSWDDPPRKHLPEFRLADPEADAEVTIRDLLSHRAGMASMTLLWYGNDVTSPQVLEAFGRAELLHPFRKRFNYSNIAFLAAGLASANAAGTDWSSLLSDRLLEPLGMASTNASFEAARLDPGMAVGYRWLEDEQELATHPMRDVGPVAPAGAINSSARDMAQWVRLQLRRGVYGDRRLISEAAHAETWTPHITIAEDVEYGLGWFRRDWRGRTLIEHSGGIDGFTAKVALLPDEDLGFVVLTNLFATPLAEVSVGIVFDALLGTWEPSATPQVEENVAGLLGTYIGNFGPFQDAEFEVLVQNGRLAVDVPGQMIFELKPPDESGRRRFTISDAIAVWFESGVDDRTRSMTLEQGGFAFELPREGVELPVEIDLERPRAYLGTYELMGDGDGEPDGPLEVVLQNNRLALDVPGQMVFELAPPDEQGRWAFRAKDTISVEFGRDDEGRVDGLTLDEDGTTRRFERTGAAASDLPTAAELMAMVHEAHLAASLEPDLVLRATGRVAMPHLGIEGRVESLLAGDGRHRTVVDLGDFGRIGGAFDGTDCWSDTAFSGREQLSGVRRDQLERSSPLVLLGDWSNHYEQVQVTGRRTIGDREVIVARLHPRRGPSEQLHVDADSGLVVGMEQSAESPLGQSTLVRVRFEDYQTVGGVRLPSRTVTTNDMVGSMIVEYDEVTIEPAVSAAAFSLSP